MSSHDCRRYGDGRRHARHLFRQCNVQGSIAIVQSKFKSLKIQIFIEIYQEIVVTWSNGNWPPRWALPANYSTSTLNFKKKKYLNVN